MFFKRLVKEDRGNSKREVKEGEQKGNKDDSEDSCLWKEEWGR